MNMRPTRLKKFLAKRIPNKIKVKVKNLINLREVSPFIAKDLILGNEIKLNYDELINEAISSPIDYPHSYRLFVNEKKVASKPTVVGIETTNRCNLKCKMCNRDGLLREIGDMEDRIYNKAIEEAVKIGASTRLGRFGEPTLDKKIVERVRHAKRKGVPLFISLLMVFCLMKNFLRI